MRKIGIIIILATLFLTACKKEDPASSLKLTSLKECRETYEQDTNQLRKGNYPRLDFSNCEFAEFPDCEKVHYLKFDEETVIGVEESIGIVKQWLKDIDQTDIDLQRELRDASNDSGIPLDWTQEVDAYQYPSVFDNKDKMLTGRGFFVNTKSCYIQMGRNGIHQMSDGTIAKELGNKASWDALGVNAETVVYEGTLKNLSEETYELLSGKVKIGDAAKMTEAFLNKGTPYRNKDDKVSEEIVWVSVFSINNKFGYDFRLRRRYDNMPFAYSDYGGRIYYDSYLIHEDIKHAYVANDNNVSAYCGYITSQGINSIKESTSLARITDAVDYLEKKLASNMLLDVKEVGLVYCPVESNDTESNISVTTVYPTWQFQCFNRNDNRKMLIYLEVLSGKIFMYSEE